MRATTADLHAVEGPAELIDGRIVRLPLCGHRSGVTRGRIAYSLADHVDRTARGVAVGGRVGYVVPILSSGREAFCPHVSFYDGPLPDDLEEFLPGPPTFAVEVRGPSGYDSKASREMAAKRADYFEAGTLVVWDVAFQLKQVRVFRLTDPSNPEVFTLGDSADAEPVLPGWRLDVTALFA